MNPPIEHRFSATNQPKPRNRKRGQKYFKPLLKKILNSEIMFDDPILNKKVPGKIGRVIALRHVMNAMQGEHQAIKDIMDRADDENVASAINNNLNITAIKYEWNNQNNSHSVQPAALPIGDTQQPEEV